MKRRTRWIIAVAVTVALLMALLHGCQAGVTPVNVPGSTEAPVTERTADTTGAPEESKAAPETTEAAATELPEISTESTQNTESIQDTEASTEALVETEPETEASTEPTPTEPTPTEPTPTEPKPTEPAPTEPKPTTPPHSHSWSAWMQTKAPTCGAAGSETRSCSCGKSESRAVNALGHNMGGWSQTKAPTCGAEGSEARSCSRCGQTETRTIAATGAHHWNETAPTCIAAGAKSCTVCGKSETVAALGHNWVHHDEEGHWRDHITCRCGAVFYDYNEWYAHARASYDDEYLDAHSGYSDHNEWVVDKEAYDECSRCGATK